MKRSSSTPKPTNTWNASTPKPRGGGKPPPSPQTSGFRLPPSAGGPPPATPPEPSETGFSSYLEAYGNREVTFQFRGLEFRFVLSQGLFSSADIDRGTRLLLKAFSQLLDEDLARGRPPPRRILDCGCGVGVIGICAARALLTAAGTDSLRLRAQDRDELARIFTRGNALRNGLGFIEARAEPLLAGDETWDLILSNLPAKAGEPVLDDFVSRSTELLTPGGRAVVVVVNTLAGFVRTRLTRRLGERGVRLVREGPGHQVVVYERPAVQAADPPARPPCYPRRRARYEMEGITYEIGAVYGAAEFDRPGPAMELAAALLNRLGGGPLGDLSAPVLVHEGGQGHFPLWFLLFLEQNRAAAPELLLLHGRNILALEAARSNIAAAPLAAQPLILTVPGVDLGLDRDTLARAPPARGFGFIAAFPQIVPQTDPYAGIWEALDSLLAPGGAALLSLPATQAERLASRLDKRKPPGFTRLGDLKRRGFRALLLKRGQSRLS